LVYGEINGEIVFLKTAREDVLMVTINLCCLSHSHTLYLNHNPSWWWSWSYC